jgi:hypothetical protein
MRTLRHVGTGLLALTLAAGLAACGDDDDASSDTTEATDGGASSGDNDAFCGAVVDFNSAVNEIDLDETSSEADVTAAGEQLAPLSETLASDAPDDIAPAAEEIDAAVQGLTEGDATAFNQDSIFETYTGMLTGAIEACEFETVDVTGVDYAFEGVPESMEAGTVAFAFTNAGEEEHEMLIFKKADGVTESFDEIFSGPEEDAEAKIEFSGVTFAPPGGEASTLAELSAGDYAMVCFIPVGGGEDGPPHFAEGMIQEFTVE